MCGIFGIANQNTFTDAKIRKKIADKLFVMSESRGKEAAGVAYKTKDEILIYKQALLASKLIKEKKYKELFKNDCQALIGHSRLVTNGTETDQDNNQPVVRKNTVVIHNGIIVNVDVLWGHFSELKRNFEVDTEIIPALVQHFQNQKNSLSAAVKNLFGYIEGSASVAAIFKDTPELLLATNTGSLYTCFNHNKDLLLFASEKYILKRLAQKFRLLNGNSLSQVRPGTGKIINLDNFKIVDFEFNRIVKVEKLKSRPIDSFNPKAEKISPLLEYNENSNLKRCTRCILPETFPGITFDAAGVCSLCNSYHKEELKGDQKLNETVAKYKNRDGSPDVLVAFSGGRDSSYGLHFIKNVLKMNPIAFTYDWGMVTDLARRNQARICGKLGIEHIIVSADIKRKRNNIRKNVLAWLKKPDLGMVPLFMAGDKQFFYYANKLMKQNNIKLMIFCENSRLEKTNFKTAFCRVSEGQQRWAEMPLVQKAKLALYYAKNFIGNPAYLNTSLIDTLFAFGSTYLIRHNYLFLYRFIEWDEQKINSILINEYNWEVAADTNTTWRIGDGTAPFYNYIYNTIAGFSEFDTFRSNQIREGLLNREKALSLVKEENRPRYQSLKWYTDQINIDLEEAVKKINSSPKLYKK